MRFVLVGADYEENLGMCMIAASAKAAGHSATVVPFQSDALHSSVARRVLAERPAAIGLAAQFQHRGMDFLALARELRRAGFRGHITAGGHFATMAHAQILGGRFGIDSVVLYEGEETVGELLDALGEGRDLATVAGLALPDGRGGAYRTAPRPLAADLDALPLAQRYRQHSRQMGVPFIPVSGSRGCWAACSFCSITTSLRDARAHGAHGQLLRLRSPDDVGREMAMLAHAVGGSAVFCFHDENLLLPRPQDSLSRLGRMRQVLAENGVTSSAFVGKCRPDTVTDDLARELARLGVIRMYVGVENASVDGARHLNRRVEVARMDAALEAFAKAGIFACYNLLIFEPKSRLADVATNIAFMRRHAATPVNFCRAEPYLGTPMHVELTSRGNLQGGFLGSDYRIEDDRAELLFRICASAFRERNFASDGVGNRYMSLGYSAKLLQTFYSDTRGHLLASLVERAVELTRSITLDTAELLDEALDLAQQATLADQDLIVRQTARLGLRVAASNRIWQAALDAVEKDMLDFVRGEGAKQTKPVRRVAAMAQSAAVAGWLALWATGTGSSGCLGSDVVDPPPPDAGGRRDVPNAYDPLPPDANGRDSRDGGEGIDSERSDAGRDAVDAGPLVVDALPQPQDARDSARDYQYFEVDSLPPDAGARDAVGEVRDAGGSEPPVVVDPPPRDAGARDAGSEVRDASGSEPPFVVDPVVDARWGVQLHEHWTDTSPVRLKRSADLPLCLCPESSLVGRWSDGCVVARVEGVDQAFSTRWQAQGTIDGEGAEVRWRPSSDEDQLDVAVRTVDGLSFASLRLAEIHGNRRG
jgi:hypothetical protein